MVRIWIRGNEMFLSSKSQAWGRNGREKRRNGFNLRKDKWVVLTRISFEVF